MSSLFSQDEDGIRGDKEPRIRAPVRFHTGTRFHQNKGRRASEQTSPQVARAIGLPARDHTADWAVAAAQSAVFLTGS